MPFLTLPWRRTLTAVALFLVLIMAVWAVVWTMADKKYQNVINDWIENGRKAGYTIDYELRESFGFPRRVVLRFTQLRWKNPDGIAFHAEQMDLSSRPWDWQSFGAHFKGHVEIDAPLDEEGRILELAGEDGRASVRLNADGIWQLAEVELRKASFGRGPDYLCTAEELRASASRTDPPPKDHPQAGLWLDGNAQGMVLPDGIDLPFGKKVKELEATLRVMGIVPDFRKKDSVAAWNEASGVVEFDKLVMSWGDLLLTARGTLGFDDDLQPEGAFSSTIGNHEKVLKALMDSGYIAKRQGAMLNSALSLFAKPAPDKPGIEVPIAIQLGGLYFGPVKIFSLPEIEWPASAGKPAAAE